MSPAVQWDWPSLATLSVPGDRVPTYIDRIFVPEATPDRHRTAEVLYCEVANQGELYEAAAACADTIARRAEGGEPLNRDCISVLEAILSARSPGLQVPVDGTARDVAEYVRQRILDVLPQILQLGRDGDDEDLQEVCYLIPQLADSDESVMEFLRSEAQSASGDRLKMVREALQEAEEVLEEGHMP